MTQPSLSNAGPAARTTGALPVPLWQQRIAARKKVKTQLRDEAPPKHFTRGDFRGLCLPVEFPDVRATIPVDGIEAFCNTPGYKGFGNNGSVYDYYFDNSMKMLRYKTTVAPYYTARHERGYYAAPTRPYGEGAQELVQEAVGHHRANGFDFGAPTQQDGRVRATNLLYAGPAANKHGEGLWPHASTMAQQVAIGEGLWVGDYQVTAMDAALSLGVYCHENGHMLCDFPDLYQYGEVRAGCGSYCLMSFGAVADPLNPPQVGAYLKYKAGWGLPEEIAPGTRFIAPAGSNRFFILRRPGHSEYFLIENRQQSGRDAALPDEGLAVWHVDERGSNTEPDTAPAGHRNYECALVQADGRNDLVGHDDGDDSDLFGVTAHAVFPAGGRPSTLWWDGKPSGLQILYIRKAADGLEFMVA